MADWDRDSPTLRNNLHRILRGIRDDARRRKPPSLDDARRWHSDMMAGLDVPDPKFTGKFRGEAGVEKIRVIIGSHEGSSPESVAADLERFETVLGQAVRRLDELLPPGADLDADSLAAVFDVCAWAHAEWVRIHPFVNGNGRTARLWANSLLMRYGLPPFVRLRPRPDGGYGSAGEAAMRGDWRPTASVFVEMYEGFMTESEKDL